MTSSDFIFFSKLNISKYNSRDYSIHFDILLSDQSHSAAPSAGASAAGSSAFWEAAFSDGAFDLFDLADGGLDAAFSSSAGGASAPSGPCMSD